MNVVNVINECVMLKIPFLGYVMDIFFPTVVKEVVGEGLKKLNWTMEKLTPVDFAVTLAPRIIVKNVLLFMRL